MDLAFKLLTELSVDPFRLEDFLREPDPLAPEAPPFGLSPDASWSRCAICGDPGYDPLPDPDVPAPEATLG
jgi:hypothetical protein